MAQVLHLRNTTGPNIELKLRCPECGHLGTFGPTPAADLIYQPRGEPENARAGVRICPNRDCQALVFFTGLRGSDGQGITTYPSSADRLNLAHVPPAVAAALTEAIDCYECRTYVAAVIMVRKALEGLCHERGATKGMLGQRLKALKAEVILPEKLFELMESIQLLGNDAAHVEMRDFREIGEPEADLAISLGQKVVEAVYGYTDLMRRVDELKKADDDG